MKKYPNLWSLEGLLESVDTSSVSVDGKTWVPGRPIGFQSIGNRIKCAWLVFTGKADAVTWPAGQ